MGLPWYFLRVESPLWQDFWNPKKDAKIQSKKDLKSKQRRIWNLSKEGFEIQVKKDFDIHAKKYTLGRVTNRDLIQNFWIYE